MILPPNAEAFAGTFLRADDRPSGADFGAIWQRDGSPAEVHR
jgi:hypothetical protein